MGQSQSGWVSLWVNSWPGACVINASFTGIHPCNLHFCVTYLKFTAKCLYSWSTVHLYVHLTMQVQNKGYFSINFRYLWQPKNLRVKLQTFVHERVYNISHRKESWRIKSHIFPNVQGARSKGLLEFLERERNVSIFKNKLLAGWNDYSLSLRGSSKNEMTC